MTLRTMADVVDAEAAVNTREAPEASIVVRTKNAARILPRTLRAIHAQRGPSFELLVVDSGSTDETLTVAQAAGARLVSMSPQTFTFGAALNLGVAEARGLMTVFISADAEPMNSAWLAALLAPFADPHVAAVYGRQVARPGAHPLERREYARWYGEIPRTDTADPFFSNANAAVRTALARARPFDATLLASEDWEWARWAHGQGYRIVYEPRASVWHSHELETLPQMYHRAWREAYANARIGADHPISLFRHALTVCRLCAEDAWFLVARGHAGAVASGIIRRMVIEAGRYAGLRDASRAS